MDLLRRPQGQEVLHPRHIGQAVGRVVIVHGHRAPGADIVTDLFGALGIHRVDAAHRHQHRVHRADGRQLLRCQLVPQVPQMGHGHATGGENSDGVGPPQGAALVVVAGLHLPDGEGALPPRQQLHPVHRVVVEVVVAAKYLMGLYPQVRVALHAGVGVRDDPVSVLLQHKAGVSQPGQFHMQSSSAW